MDHPWGKGDPASLPRDSISVIFSGLLGGGVEVKHRANSLERSFSMICFLGHMHQNRLAVRPALTQLLGSGHTKAQMAGDWSICPDTMTWESTSQPCPGLTSSHARCALKRMATCSWPPCPCHISLHLTLCKHSLNPRGKGRKQTSKETPKEKKQHGHSSHN